MRILILEDHEDTCMALALPLEDAGHIVDCAHNYDDAVSMVQISDSSNELYDAIIADIDLKEPDRNGWLFLSKCYDLFGDKIKLIVCTGIYDLNIPAHAVYDEIIKKPVSNIVLLRAIEGRDEAHFQMAGIMEQRVRKLEEHAIETKSQLKSLHGDILEDRNRADRLENTIDQFIRESPKQVATITRNTNRALIGFIITLLVCSIGLYNALLNGINKTIDLKIEVGVNRALDKRTEIPTTKKHAKNNITKTTKIAPQNHKLRLPDSNCVNLSGNHDIRNFKNAYD